MKSPVNLLLPRLVDAIRQAVPDAEAVYLFGSQAGDNARPDSDLDLAVLASAPLRPETQLTLNSRLAELAGCNVDLLDLHAVSTVMRSQVIANGQRIYCSDETGCGNFEDMVYSSYARLNEERRGILADIRARGRIHA